MWKCLGVATLWVLLISLPHLGGPQLQAMLGGVAPVLAIPGDDPGNPFRLAAAEQRDESREAATSYVTIHFRNELDKTLTLNEVQIVMDGKLLPVVQLPAPNADVVMFQGHVSPGHHILKTSLVCQGNQRAVIKYMNKYKFTFESEQVMTVPEKRTVVFTIGAHRNKSFNVPFEKQVEIKASAQDMPSGGESLTN